MTEQHTATEKTVSADKFASIMSAWPNDEKQLGYIAEAVLEGQPHKHFDQVSTVEGGEIVMRQTEGDTFRTNAADYMAHIESAYPEQMAEAKAEVAGRAGQKPAGIDLVAETAKFEARTSRPAEAESQTETLTR